MNNTALNDQRTRTRLANLRRLIAELQVRPVQCGDVCDLLGVSESTGRNYFKEIATLLEIVPTTLLTYQLTGDAARVMAFVNALGDEPIREIVPRPRPVAKGRQIHILADDVPFRVRMARFRPERDWLVAALFGSGQVGACV